MDQPHTRATPEARESVDRASRALERLGRRRLLGVGYRAVLMGSNAMPERYERPSLAELFDKNSLNLALAALFGGDPVRRTGHRDHVGLWTNFVRLTDKAIREYETTFQELDELLAHFSGGRVSPFFRAIDHMESCLNATHRAALCSQALRDLDFGTGSEPLDDNEIGQIRAVRVAIEHLDSRLLRGEVPDGLPYMLSLERTGLRLGTAHLSYLTLSRSIVKLYNHVEAIRGPSK